MTKKDTLDAAFTLGAPFLFTFMVWLLLKIPKELPFKWLTLDDEWLRRNLAKILGIIAVCIGAPAVYAGAAIALEILSRGWSPEVLRYLYTYVLAALTILVPVNFLPTIKTAASAIVAMVVGTVVWLVWPNWITTGALALVSIFVIVAALMPRVMRFVVLVPILLAAGAGYDYFNVYVTGAMERAIGPAVEARLPMLLTIPESLALDAPPASGLGLLDVFVVLVLLLTAARMSLRTRRLSIYVAAIGGFLVAETAVIWVGRTTQHWQPAALYHGVAISAGIAMAALLTHNGQELLRRGEYDTPQADV